MPMGLPPETEGEFSGAAEDLGRTRLDVKPEPFHARIIGLATRVQVSYGAFNTSHGALILHGLQHVRTRGTARASRRGRAVPRVRTAPGPRMPKLSWVTGMS